MYINSTHINTFEVYYSITWMYWTIRRIQIRRTTGSEQRKTRVYKRKTGENYGEGICGYIHQICPQQLWNSQIIERPLRRRKAAGT